MVLEGKHHKHTCMKVLLRLLGLLLCKRQPSDQQKNIFLKFSLVAAIILIDLCFVALVANAFRHLRFDAYMYM